MKAQNLREALNLLDPEHSLCTPEELRDYFVERPLSPLQRLTILLQDSREPKKILFTGHTGSGKTTELARLALALKTRFFIIHCSAKSHLNLFDLTYADVLISLGLELLREVSIQKITVNPKVFNLFLDFAREITIEVQSIDRKGIEGGIEVGPEVGAFVAKLSGKLRTEDNTRISIRKTLVPRLSDLFENIELLSQEVKRITGRPVLAIVDGLDKTDLHQAEDLYYKHATSLLAPRLSIIYTFPIELRFDNHFMQIRSNFPNIEVLPNLKIRNRDKSPDPEGLARLREILTKRVEENLFTSHALDKLIANSSGIPRELIALSGLACLEARVAGRPVIDEIAVEQAIKNRQRDYQVLLTAEHLELLRRVQQTNWLDNNEKNQPLLGNLTQVYHCH